MPGLEGFEEEGQRDVIPLMCSIFLANRGAGEGAGEGEDMPLVSGPTVQIFKKLTVEVYYSYLEGVELIEKAKAKEENIKRTEKHIYLQGSQKGSDFS